MHHRLKVYCVSEDAPIHSYYCVNHMLYYRVFSQLNNVIIFLPGISCVKEWLSQYSI